ncbi:protoporphyrinogen oxidase [Acidihalobacter prosperus]|uniref:Protoporphyrinogen IX oxidase, aerobic n=1 Tax=Acidihalobacter prosperus TaxID=160660 RepID=A0A1A6C2I6_9GAMM|nr:protoporphyrinogen oxidase [Acidihalobacter prosperus]OBS08764.1 Protoporphyrinogen IX oxidase, aerobic [Acidihalobacter prosperus]
MNDFLIVGAGISGLTVAWTLRRRGARVRLLEADALAGGKIRSRRRDGFLLDAGPNSLLDRGEGLGRLIDALGLGERVVEANTLAQRRYVVRAGRVIALPTSLMAFVRTPLFSLGAKLRLLSEPWRARAEHDESVARFVRRRLGPEFLDWAVDPFVSGVYAGDPERLSVRAATGRIHALEAEAGSLFRGALRRARQGRASGPVPKGRMISFREGIGELTDALAEAMGDDLLVSRPVHALRRTDRHWVAETSQGAETGETLVLAVPSFAAADLLDPFDGRLAAQLREIEYPGVVSLALGFAREQVRHPLDGFGLLIPSREGCETLGVLFSSTLFPDRAPPGRVLLTAFIGGARNPAATARDDAALIATAVDDLGPLLGLTGAPVFSEVSRWPRAIPQYTVGHLDRMANIAQGLNGLPGLQVAANWRGGVAVGDCINNALSLADTLLPPVSPGDGQA